MRCPTCEGKGEWIEYSEPEIGTLYTECGHCGESGEITLWAFITYTFWQHAPVRFVEWYCDWRYSLEEGK